MTKKPNISVSAVDTWEECQTKWYYGYVERRRSTSASLAIGTAVHDLLEAYLKGVDIDEADVHWPIAAQGLEHIPTPAEVAEYGWVVEEWLNAKCNGMNFKGKTDILLPPGSGMENGRLVVVDHKTSGGGYDRRARRKDPFKYVPTAEDLAKKNQPLIYAYVSVKQLGIEPPADFDIRYVYYTYDKSKLTPTGSRVVNARKVPWDRAVHAWEKFKRVAVEMLAALEKTVEELDVNPSACQNFGGCPHRSYCPLHTGDKDAVVEEKKRMDKIQDKLREKIRRKAQEPAAKTLAKGAEAVVADSKEKADEHFAALRAKPTLYLGCTPNPMPRPLTAVLRKAIETVEAENRGVPFRAIDYNNGYKQVAGVFAQDMNAELGEDCVAQPDDMLARLIAEVVEERGTAVVVRRWG